VEGVKKGPEEGRGREGVGVEVRVKEGWRGVEQGAFLALSDSFPTNEVWSFYKDFSFGDSRKGPKPSKLQIAALIRFNYDVKASCVRRFKFTRASYARADRTSEQAIAAFLIPPS
jgi:hypothetical protein